MSNVWKNYKMDILTPEQRHKNMSAIRSKNTFPENFLRKQLFALGYRYRINAKNITGHPDLYFRKYNTAIFIHGCFWHRHKNCRYSTSPTTRQDFWNKKFETNKKRDDFVKEELGKQNIKCLIIWECTIKNMKKDPEFKIRILKEIQNFIKNNSVNFMEL